MNKRNKIIVSVVGITIVLLALLGITYAYYLTRIEGNTNTNSISVTTAKLELVYGDNSAEIISGTGALVPDSDNPIGTKTFTVTNNGNDTNYVVIIDNVSVTKASDGTKTTFLSNDFRYTLSCSVKDKSGNVLSGEKCNNVETLSVFPIKGGILVGNAIPENKVHEYTLTLWYIDTGKDQTDDMGKSLQARVNISDVAQMENPFKTGVTEVDNASLAYNVVNNAKLNKNGTRFLNAPETKVAEEISSYGSGKYNTIREYYSNWEDGYYEWAGLTYGATRDLADYGVKPSSIEEGTDPVTACNSVKGQYISDSYNCNYYGCDSIGKVVDCEEDGTPVLEENEDYTSWEDGGYEWDYLTYGATQDLADHGVKPSSIEEGTDPVEACNSVKGQYISDNYYCNYYLGCYSIGKVVDCESDGTPILDENYDEYKEEIMLPEQTLSVTPDDYGTSYYFRGNVEDNYVNFAGMCWRIVRIAGDGTTKLILEDQFTTCNDTETETTTAVYTGNWNIGTGNYGFERKNVEADSSNENIMNYLNPVTGKTSSMVKAFYDFQTTKLADYTGKLKAGDWCLADKAYTQSGSYQNYTYTPLEEYNYSSDMYYDSYVRLNGDNKDGYQPTLKCNGTILNEFATVSGVSSNAPMYVSTLTADEMAYAGGKAYRPNKNFYLINEEFKKGSSGANKANYFWSLSPYKFNGIEDYAFDLGSGALGSVGVYYHGVDGNGFVFYYNAFRPAVSLASSAVITGGEGTLEKPYVIG